MVQHVIYARKGSSIDSSFLLFMGKNNLSESRNENGKNFTLDQWKFRML